MPRSGCGWSERRSFIVPSVLADVDIHGELDLGRAAGLVTDRTKAVVITHMWGNPQTTRRSRDWCDARGLALVEHCSHAHGAARDGRQRR